MAASLTPTSQLAGREQLQSDRNETPHRGITPLTLTLTLALGLTLAPIQVMRPVLEKLWAVGTDPATAKKLFVRARELFVKQARSDPWGAYGDSIVKEPVATGKARTLQQWQERVSRLRLDEFGISSRDISSEFDAIMSKSQGMRLEAQVDSASVYGSRQNVEMQIKVAVKTQQQVKQQTKMEKSGE